MPSDLNWNDTDHAILDMLKEGRCTPTYIEQETGFSYPNISTQLTRMVEHGVVTRLATGLYELNYDPRVEDAPDPDVDDGGEVDGE